MSEQWRPICDGHYLVSNEGGIRRAIDGVNTTAGRTRKTPLSTSGYPMFISHVNGNAKLVYVHRAVAEAFIGPCPAGHVVNHIDGDKTNSRVANLEYVTPKQNAQHASAMGLLPTGDDHWARRHPEYLHMGDAHWTRRLPEQVARGANNGAVKHPEKILKGEKCPASRLKEQQVLEIRRLSKAGASPANLASLFGVSRENIGMIVRRKSWKHLP